MFMTKSKMIWNFIGIGLFDTLIGAIIMLVVNGLMYVILGIPFVAWWIIGITAFIFAGGHMGYKFLIQDWVIVHVRDGYIPIDVAQLIREAKQEEEK